jgi:hypothetical protein
VAKELADVAVVEVSPDMEGKTMLMVLAPAKKTSKSSAAPAAPRPPRKTDAKPGEKTDASPEGAGVSSVTEE